LKKILKLRVGKLDISKGVTTYQLEPFKDLISSRDPFLPLRFFAALLVFTTHMVIVFKPSQDLFEGYWRILAGNAHAGMAVFFTLSGFLMGKAFLTSRYKLNSEGIIDFYKNRWIRIFPLMTFVLLIYLIFEYPEILRFQPLSIQRVLTFNFSGTGGMGVPGIGAMWSLAVEFQYYLIAPFIFALFDGVLRKNKIIGFIYLVTTIGILLLLRHYLNKYFLTNFGIPNFTFTSLLGNLPYFLIGFMANYANFSVSEKYSKAITNSWYFGLILALLFGLFTLISNHLISSILSVIIIIILDSVGKSLSYRTLKRYSLFKIFEILGILSYGLYLWHSGIATIQSKLFSSGHFNTHEAYLNEVFIVFVLIIVVSLMSYYLVESRFNSYKSPRFNS